MPDKVLLVCSSTAANIQKAREILRRRTSFDRPEFHLLCSPSDLPYLQKEPPARRVWVFPHRRDLGNGFRLWLRLLRQRYRAVAVLWCGDRARLRPKLFALACGGRRILVFDEHLECSPSQRHPAGQAAGRPRPPAPLERRAGGTGAGGGTDAAVAPGGGGRVAGAVAAGSGALPAAGRGGAGALRREAEAGRRAGASRGTLMAGRNDPGWVPPVLLSPNPDTSAGRGSF